MFHGESKEKSGEVRRGQIDSPTDRPTDEGLEVGAYHDDARHGCCSDPIATPP